MHALVSLGIFLSGASNIVLTLFTTLFFTSHTIFQVDPELFSKEGFLLYMLHGMPFENQYRL